MTDYKVKALTATYKALQGLTFTTIADAQEAAHAAILAKMSDGFDGGRINIDSTEQGAGASVEIRVEPTEAKGDAFGIVYEANLGDHGWTFAFARSFDVNDGDGE